MDRPRVVACASLGSIRAGGREPTSKEEKRGGGAESSSHTLIHTRRGGGAYTRSWQDQADETGREIQS